MPEIAEVARIVHFIKKSLVGKTLSVVKTQEDANVYGKVGTSAAEFQKALTGKKVLDAGQQGKYFWMIMSEPPHPVMHFGMNGWFHIKGEQTAKYASKSKDYSDWPPKYWKFAVETDEEPKVEAAFTDSRRFARIRLVDCPGENIRNVSPLKENGPDPVIDKDIFTLEWFSKKMLSKKVPVKALMLDQANISGIGNWVGDEILYHAKLHPEQYSDTFSPEQLKTLHSSILHICQTAVDLLADASKFPEDWLFSHRWGKGKKDGTKTLPSGEKIIFITVGGRTSCVVPSRQKKTGPVTHNIEVDADEDVSEDVKADLVSSGDEVKSVKKKASVKKGGKTKAKENTSVKDEDTHSEDMKPTVNGARKAGKKRSAKTESKENEHEDASVENAQKTKKRKIEVKKVVDDKVADSNVGRRRSGRLGNS